MERKTSTILKVLCLARVNKGAVVITEDLQVVCSHAMVLLILFLVIWSMDMVYGKSIHWSVGDSFELAHLQGFQVCCDILRNHTYW